MNQLLYVDDECGSWIHLLESVFTAPDWAISTETDPETVIQRLGD